jgi:glycerophosphoryl diester phosphodiesterase
MPLWIAHRGAGKLAPENTLAAFRLGAAHGYRAFECDVKLSADRVPFLLHDDTLNRTTSARGPAAAKNWAELAVMDAGGWHSRAYAGEPPASLSGVVQYVQRNGYALNLELKPSPGVELLTGEVVGKACAELWHRTELLASAPLLFSSFKPDALQGAKNTAPHLPRALLLDKLWPGWLATAQALGCVAVVTNYNLMDSALIAQLHTAGLRALCYTVNDAPEAQRLLTLDIDGIITDAVNKFSPGGAVLLD